MSTLLIFLPLAPALADTEFDYVLSHDGVSVASAGRALAEALPQLAAGDERLAVAPLRALSWHRVTLPEGVAPGSARLRAVLVGLLEDQVLDDPARLHFALPPQWRAGQPQWLAVCDRRWLAMNWQALEAAGRPVARVVPEWGPPGAQRRLHVTGSADDPQLVVCDQASVGIFPLDANATAWLSAPGGALAPSATAGAETGAEIGAETGGVAAPAPAVLSADPDLLALASAALQRPVQALTPGERWLQAARSPWDLARHAQMRQRADRGKYEWLRAPRWRTARWAAGALLGVNLLGLNALAWAERQRWQASHAAMTQVLGRSFPKVVVVDAPVQMARELQLLAQDRAAASAADLDVMLGVLGRALPPERSAQALDYANGQLSLKGLALPAAESAALASALQARGYRVTSEGANLLLQPLPSASSSSSSSSSLALAPGVKGRS